MEAVQLKRLRVAADMDSSGFVAGSREMEAAQARLSAGNKLVSVTLADTTGKVSAATGDIGKLSRAYIDGYGTAYKLETGLRSINRALEQGKIDVAQASAIYQGMTTRLGAMADGTSIARQGYVQLGSVIDDVNMKMSRAAQQAHATRLATAQSFTPVNDNMSGRMGGADGFRRQNLGFQLQDIGVGLYGGMPVTTVLVQQGSQLLGLYGGNGGVSAAFKDFAGILGTVARAAGPWIAAAAAGYGAYKLLASYSVEAGLGVDSATQALADQAAPLSTVKGQIDELGGLQKTYRDAIASTGDISTTATNTIVANVEREFAAKKALLELETLRQEAALKVNASQQGLAGLSLRQELGAGINTRMDLERQGFADPRIGSVPFVRLPDEITGLEKTQAMIDASPVAQELKRLRAEGELTKIVFEKLQDAINATVNGTDLITGAGKAGTESGQRIPIPQFRGLDDQPGSVDFMQDAQRQHELRMRGLQDEARLLGLTGAAAASLRAEQEMLAAAYAKNVELTPGQLRSIRDQAAAYGQEKDALARREGQFNEIRDGVKGFATDFKDALLDNGGDLGDAFGQAFLNGFSNAMDKQLERIFEQMANGIAGPVCGPAFSINFEQGIVE
ncbi:phage tail length tape measure family protein [Mesorhizobium yinganensis]|uniref:phage tail length tape measure family protein n=1 Tax=Mesorhizobium yinganensis TaxID=3157707 RepID=UPI0032B7359D